MRAITPATPGTVRLMFTWDSEAPVDGKPEVIWRVPVVSWITEEDVVGQGRERRWKALPVSPFDLAFGWDGPIEAQCSREALLIDGVVYELPDGSETFASEKDWIEACLNEMKKGTE